MSFGTPYCSRRYLKRRQHLWAEVYLPYFLELHFLFKTKSDFGEFLFKFYIQHEYKSWIVNFFFKESFFSVVNQDEEDEDYDNSDEVMGYDDDENSGGQTEQELEFIHPEADYSMLFNRYLFVLLFTYYYVLWLYSYVPMLCYSGGREST